MAKYESQDRIRFQESPRDHRTEIPNIVFELLKNNEITSNDFVLYCTYRKIAGEHGECFVGTRGLSEMCDLSTPTITKSKRALSKPFKRLLGKSLIEIIPGDKALEQADTVTIMDVWLENHEYFKNKLTCVKNHHTPVQKTTTPLCKKPLQKNEPVKKKPYNKVSIAPVVHNSPSSDPPVKAASASPPSSGIAPSASYVSATPTPAEGSNSFSQEKGEGSFFSPELLELLELETQYQEYFRPKIVGFWIKRHGPAKVLAMVQYFFLVKSKQKKPILNPEAWMEEGFKKEFNKDEINTLQNKQFAEEMKRRRNCRALKINKRYCVDTRTGESAYYTLPRETFEHLVMKFCNITKKGFNYDSD